MSQPANKKTMAVWAGELCGGCLAVRASHPTQELLATASRSACHVASCHPSPSASRSQRVSAPSRSAVMQFTGP
jgi:hypothetical protein